EQLQGALLALAVASSASSPEAAKEQARGAWTQIEKISHGTNPASLEALMILARRVLATPAPGGTTSVSSTGQSEAGGERADVSERKSELITENKEPITDNKSAVVPTLSATELSRLLENHPLAQLTQKLIALDLLEHEDP